MNPKEMKMKINSLFNPVHSGAVSPARTTPRRLERASGRNMRRVTVKDIKPQSKLGQVYHALKSLSKQTGCVYGNDFHIAAVCGMKGGTVRWAIRKLEASEIITVEFIAGERLIYLVEDEYQQEDSL